jgi:hypothetical protein
MEMVVRPVNYKAAGKSNGVRQSSRRHFRCGVRAAGLRAMTAGRMYLSEGGNITLEEAAARCGSNVAYVRAAIALIKAGDEDLIDQVMLGNLPIMATAKLVKPLVTMLAGYAKATPYTKGRFFAITGCTDDLGRHLVASTLEQRLKAAARLGTAQVWDTMINPLLEAAE